MAFIDDSDLKQPEPAPEPQVVYMQGPRSKLVPVLLVTLNVAVLIAIAGGIFIFSGGSISWPAGGDDVGQTSDAPSADDLDPDLLVTPNGRRLDVVEFGGYLFEVTRIAYSNNAYSRSVTITVPASAKGEVPQQGMFHIGESFASGDIRVVEITSSSVVLETGDEQRVFPIRGATAIVKQDSAPPGKSYIAPRNTGAIPDMPDGQVRAPKHPLTNEPDDEPSSDERSRKLGDMGGDGTIDDLKDIRTKSLARENYLELVKMMPDIFAEDFIFGVALERDTRMPYGLEILNIAATSFFFTHGLEVGDVIYAINGHPVHRIVDLDQVVRSNFYHDEIRIELEREIEAVVDGESVYDIRDVTFVFNRGLGKK